MFVELFAIARMQIDAAIVDEHHEIASVINKQQIILE